MTPSEMPRLAMMNENSPIGAREMPPLNAVSGSGSWPESIIPIVANISLATTASIAIGTIEVQRAAIIPGSTIIPTDRKNIAPNMSLMPAVTLSTLWTCRVPAKSDPAMNAPSSIEKPSQCASIPMRKQKPRLSSVRVSSLISPIVLSRMVGRKNMPRISQSTR